MLHTLNNAPLHFSLMKEIGGEFFYPFTKDRYSIDDLKPRRPISPEERMKMWTQYASDEQKNAANQIYQAARAAGRRLNRNDFRKLRDIERTIKIPENNEQRRP